MSIERRGFLRRRFLTRTIGSGLLVRPASVVTPHATGATQTTARAYAGTE